MLPFSTRHGVPTPRNTSTAYSIHEIRPLRRNVLVLHRDVHRLLHHVRLFQGVLVRELVERRDPLRDEKSNHRVDVSVLQESVAGEKALLSRSMTLVSLPSAKKLKFFSTILASNSMTTIGSVTDIAMVSSSTNWTSPPILL